MTPENFPSKIECANSSSLELTSTGILIWLPMQVFGALWFLLVSQLSGIIDSSPIVPFNQRKMTLRDAEPKHHVGLKTKSTC